MTRHKFLLIYSRQASHSILWPVLPRRLAQPDIDISQTTLTETLSTMAGYRPPSERDPRDRRGNSFLRLSREGLQTANGRLLDADPRPHSRGRWNLISALSGREGCSPTLAYLYCSVLIVVSGSGRCVYCLNL
ncbi:hypothetical protein J6590_025704 [Homalodisca vitripennis]|nr:hypothetical protein J6590_025704 [Homalodisca vitripennis]